MILVFEATTTLVAVMEAAPALVSCTVAPAWNPVPARLVIEIVVPIAPELGLIPVTEIPVKVTLNPFFSVPDWPSWLVTTTS